LQKNSLTGNRAGRDGGGVYYDLYSPVGLQDNFFANNTATYGKDYASYPYQLLLVNDSTS